MKYKYLSHTADCKFQAYGKTLEEAFSNALLAMINHLTPVDKIEGVQENKIKVKSTRLDSLLYDFLEEFLFLIDTEKFLASEVKKIKIKHGSEYELEATVLGDSYENYETIGDVKAITYNDMFIKEEDGQWVVQVVVDI